MEQLISNPYTVLCIYKENGKYLMRFTDYDEAYTVEISKSFYLEMENIIKNQEKYNEIPKND